MVFPADDTSIKVFEDLSKVCILMYAIDEELQIRLSQAWKMEYLTLGLVFVLEVDSEAQSSCAFIQISSHLFNLSIQTGDTGK